jgi:hypothetical protein
VGSVHYRYALYEGGAEELYDLDADPGELKNLAALAEYADEKAALRALLPRTPPEQRAPRGPAARSRPTPRPR